MNIWNELAHEIIDIVENNVRTFHPEVEQHVQECHAEDDDGNIVNTLFYGENYDKTESEVAQYLKEFFHLIKK